MDFFDALISILDSTIRLSVPLLLACLAGLYSERSGVFDIGLEGKMLAAPSPPAAAAARLPAPPGSGLRRGIVAVDRLRAACTALPRSPIAATRSSPASPSTSSPPASTVLLGKAWFSQGGRTPPLPATARFQPIDLPFADALRDVPVIGPIYAEPDLRPHHPRLCRLPGGAADLVGALPHALRPAAARRRRKPGGGRHGRHLGDLAALPRASSARRALPASPAPIWRSRRPPASSRT